MAHRSFCESTPPPANVVMGRELTHLTDITPGAMVGAEDVGTLLLRSSCLGLVVLTVSAGVPYDNPLNRNVKRRAPASHSHTCRLRRTRENDLQADKWASRNRPA